MRFSGPTELVQFQRDKEHETIADMIGLFKNQKATFITNFILMAEFYYLKYGDSRVRRLNSVEDMSDGFYFVFGAPIRDSGGPLEVLSPAVTRTSMVPGRRAHTWPRVFLYCASPLILKLRARPAVLSPAGGLGAEAQLEGSESRASD